LREHVEKHREEIELSRAVATLMLAKTPEDIKQFEDYLHLVREWVQKDATPIGVEAAKKLIIDRLMPGFRAFECSNCNTRFVVDTPKPIEDSSLYCPICLNTHHIYIARANSKTVSPYACEPCFSACF
jgi:hypothetical protein